jgi:hypothetical protein
MKCSEFELGKGEFSIIATYTEHNDAAESDESTTIRTHERGRPRLYTDAATLALAAEKYFELGDLKVQLRKINFTENDDGRFAKVSLETLSGIKVSPPRVKREEYIEPGEDEPNPEHPLNVFLAAVDLVENRISEYLSGDREQPDLPVKAEPEARPAPGLFDRGKGAVGGRRKKAAAVLAETAGA